MYNSLKVLFQKERNRNYIKRRDKMTIAVCIDDKNGMMFNKRRQSRDSELIRDFVELCGDGKILISSFSEKLFADFQDRVTVDDSFLDGAEEDDICFVENADVTPFAERINKIILYRWNRHYPSDFKFTFDLSGYTLTESKDFEGSSHENITREVYVK